MIHTLPVQRDRDSGSHGTTRVTVALTTGSTTTDLIWDRLVPLPLVVDDGTMAYLHAGGLLAEIDGSDDVLYHLTDALGSVRGLVDDAGDLVGTAEYEAFGGVRASSGSSSVFGFTGELTDPTTGFVHLRARDYNTTTGRFLSMDTVQPNAPGTQGYNRCAYTANNPARWTDPSGHSVGDMHDHERCANASRPYARYLELAQ